MKYKYAPLIIFELYIFLTIYLFFYGSFNWIVVDVHSVFLFLCFFAILFFVAYFFGINSKKIYHKNDFFSFFFQKGCVLNILVMFFAMIAYTKKYPWDIFYAMSNQAEAYADMLSNLQEDRSVIRYIVIVLKAIFSPWLISFIPLGIINFERLNGFWRILFFFSIWMTISFSILRGTDKETVDLFIIVCIALCVRKLRVGKIGLNRLLLILIVLFFVFCLFIYRKYSRLNGNMNFCIGDTEICTVNYSDSILQFAMDMLAGYLSQGYYGLSLALNSDFDFSYGLGHSAFLMSVAGFSGGYLNKINQMGWDTASQWSTIFPWVASDLSFFGAPFFVAAFAFFWGSSYKSAIVEKNDAGAIIFILLSVCFFYIPANNQLTQTLDAYLGFVFWLVVYLGFGQRRS